MNKGVLLFFVLVAAGGFAVAHNWEEISVALEFEDSSEQRALDLAKADRSLVSHRTNEKAIDEELDSAEAIEVIGWQVETKSERLFIVKFLYKQNGKPRGYYFEVDLVSRNCCPIEEYSELAEKYSVKPSRPE